MGVGYRGTNGIEHHYCPISTLVSCLPWAKWKARTRHVLKRMAISNVQSSDRRANRGTNVGGTGCNSNALLKYTISSRTLKHGLMATYASLD